jgi:hypothetical protein
MPRRRRLMTATVGPIVINSNTQVSLQEGELQTITSEDVAELEVGEASEESNIVETTDFGDRRRGFFSISVTGDEKDEKGNKKVLYENKKEPFVYDFCNSLVSVLRHAGAKLADDKADFLADALKSEDAEADKSIGEAVLALVKIYNGKEKADAKSSAYAAIVNKYKPLEGEKRDTAIARMIATNVKLMGVSAETVIQMLQTMKPSPIPADYTVVDFNNTPLRKTKGEGDDE